MAVKRQSDTLQAQLLAHWGPVVGGEALAQALGFPSTGALRQSIARGQLSISLFKIPGRRGRFALTKDVADWLALQSSHGGDAGAAPLDDELALRAPKKPKRKGGRHGTDVI